MKKALLIIDAQNDFITGALASDKKCAIRDKIYNKCIEAVKNGIDIFMTKDCHGENYENTKEGKTYPKHCLYGTEGQQIDNKLSEFIDVSVEVIDKSTFGSVNVVRSLLDRKYDEIEIVGYVLEVCVFANAVMLQSTALNTNITLDAECIAMVDKKNADKFYDIMETMGINIINKKVKVATTKKTVAKAKSETKAVSSKVATETKKTKSKPKTKEEAKPVSKTLSEKKEKEKVEKKIEKKAEQKVVKQETKALDKKAEKKPVQDKKVIDDKTEDKKTADEQPKVYVNHFTRVEIANTPVGKKTATETKNEKKTK